MATFHGDSLACLTVRTGDDEGGRYWEPGVIGHGPGATELAEHVATEFATWAREQGSDAAEPGFRMVTGAHRDLLEAADPRFVIDKPHASSSTGDHLAAAVNPARPTDPAGATSTLTFLNNRGSSVSC